MFALSVISMSDVGVSLALGMQAPREGRVLQSRICLSVKIGQSQLILVWASVVGDFIYIYIDPKQGSQLRVHAMSFNAS